MCNFFRKFLCGTVISVCCIVGQAQQPQAIVFGAEASLDSINNVFESNEMPFKLTLDTNFNLFLWYDTTIIYVSDGQGGGLFQIDHFNSYYILEWFEAVVVFDYLLLVDANNINNVFISDRYNDKGESYSVITSSLNLKKMHIKAYDDTTGKTIKIPFKRLNLREYLLFGGWEDSFLRYHKLNLPSE